MTINLIFGTIRILLQHQICHSNDFARKKSEGMMSDHMATECSQSTGETGSANAGSAEERSPLDLLKAVDSVPQSIACSTSVDKHSSVIVRFYRDGDRDTLGRKLAEMQHYDDYDMERCHDHMQWMFPLHEPSMFASMYEILKGKSMS